MPKPLTPQQLADLRIVEQVFAEGFHCGDCAYCRDVSQFHPYGSTVAKETLYECAVLEGKVPLESCPGLEPMRQAIEDGERGQIP